MNLYDITIFYACHGSQENHPGFSQPAKLAERIQFIPITEDDPLHPRYRTFECIKEAAGRYTIFLDEGDILEPADRFFSHMLAIADKYAKKASFFMPSIITQLTDTGTHYFSTRESVDFSINTDICPTILPMDLHGLLIPTAMLLKVLPEISPVEPEKSIIVHLLALNPVIFFVGTCHLLYTYPHENDVFFDVRYLSREWYYKPFEEFLLPLLEKEQNRRGYVGQMLQVMALFMIHMRIFANIDNRNKNVIHRQEVPEYCELLSHVLQFIDIMTILSSRMHASATSHKYRLLDIRLKLQDFSWYPNLVSDENTLELLFKGLRFTSPDVISAQISLIDYHNDCLEIDGAINDYFSLDNVSVYAKLGTEKFPVTFNQRYSMSKCFGVTFSRQKTFHVSVPIQQSDEHRILNFIIHANDKDHIMSYSFPAHTSRFAKDFTYTYWKFGPYLSYWNKEGIHIVKSKKWKILVKEFKLWKQIRKSRNEEARAMLPLKILNFLLQPYFSRQKIWLFFDKIYKGGDSSEYIYRYAAAQKDGIKKYYLLDESCADYTRMRKEGYHPLKRGTLKHRLIFLNANMVITSNSTVFAFNDYTSTNILPFRGNFHFDVACVQHGMSIQKIALAQQRLRDNTKLYFCASKYEIENLSKPVYDYVGYDALKLTGVPRYDGLKNRAQKILLLSPTWRMNSAMPVFKNEGVARDYNPNFRETSYYKVYNSLINDPRLLAAARKYGYRIQYVLHPIVSPQYDDFTKNDSVEIISAIGDMSYEKLFCEAALMVTDFSGVQFDFAYMRKPVVYLHHNDIPQHYEEGTFHYTTMGFGEICHTNDELIDVLCRYMENGCEMPEMYRKRADDFFAFSDNNNCERIYPVMLEHERARTR